jgi:hypothetical protein
MSSMKQPETDPRFPGGRWVGFWIQKVYPAGRHSTSLTLHFADGLMEGEGRDWVATYTVRGRYSLADGRCNWIKQYTGKHAVFYEGFNEGKGIWGTWSIPEADAKGGFHIWPEDMGDPTPDHLREEADAPNEEEREAEPLDLLREYV